MRQLEETRHEFHNATQNGISDADKRGGGLYPVTLRTDAGSQREEEVDLLSLDAALAKLAAHDPRLGQVVECRFFGGLTAAETAEAVGVSLRTVERDWTRARAHLVVLLDS